MSSPSDMFKVPSIQQVQFLMTQSKMLLDAKVSEYQAYSMSDNADMMATTRQAVHDLTDVYLDHQQAMAHEIRKAFGHE